MSALLGAALGLAAGMGVVVTCARLPHRQAPTLDDRLVPYLRDVLRNGWVPSERGRSPSTGGIGIHGVRALDGAALRSVATVVAARLGRALGGSESVRHRLERAGRSPDVERFRAEQVVWAAAGLVIGGSIGTSLWWRGVASVVPLTVLVLLAGAGGGALRDWMLSRDVARREQQMLEEFPTIAEMLALSVGAGEGPVAALERVTRLSSGELSAELTRALADVRAGATVPQAFADLGSRTGLAPLARFVDGVVVAVERGTPLADVLKAQAQDVREAGQRALMDTAGRREIAMMVPVVFMILPITVLFAVFPGFAFLRLDL